ncbi:MAG: ParA family protein [Planctomycetes bacterium]|nr:ParA family protein [Planctomycetota bacterium]
MKTRNAHRIALAGMKGGIGKTTIAIHLAAALAKRGKRTLLIDLDPQGGVDLFFATGRLTGLADYLMDRVPISRTLKRTKFDDLGLIARGKLDPVDCPEFEHTLARTSAVEDLLDLLDSRFEFVIMDLPCGLGAVTRTGLRVADHVLVPVVPEPMCNRSISQACRVIEWIREHQNPGLDLLGLIPTMIEADDVPGLEALRSVWCGFASNVDAAIPRSSQLIECSRLRKPLQMLENPPQSLLARFERLADEVLNRVDTPSEDRPNIEIVVERLRAIAPRTDLINEEFASFHAPTIDATDTAGTKQASRAIEAASLVLERLCADENFGFRSWNELLDWCQRVAGCENAFAMDQQGLVIADDGNLPTETVEDTGTRLIRAIDQADKMVIARGRAQIISIQLGSRWLTGVRIGTDGDAAFTLGLLGDKPVDEDARKTIEDVIGVVAERFYSFSAS